MRAQGKRVHHEEEEESAFVSMTDMTVGFLFIMMILLAFFVSQTRDNETVPRDLYEDVKQERDDALTLAENRAETIVRLEIKLAKLREERAALVEKRNQLLKDLETARTKLASLVIRISNLEEILSELHTKIIEKDAQIDKLFEERNSLKLERDQLSKKLNTAQSELVKLNNLIKDLEATLARLLAEIDKKDAKLEELRAKLKRLQQVDPLEAYLARVAQVRRDVLRRLRDAIRLDFPDLQVELSEESDALRFQGEGLFASNRSNLTSQKSAIVERLSQRLDEVLPCFTIGPASIFSEDCNPGFVMIEAVQIEGHTDNEGTDVRNRTLSAERANNTFFAMTRAAIRIIEHRNLKRQPVLSVAAYGPDRPVTPNDSPAGRATNRRIDLRFIMVTPQDTDGIATIREALDTISEIQR